MPVRIPTFYNLSKSVGKGKPNDRLDVMLVQFFLNERSKDHAALKADGTLGPDTLDLIRWYQEINEFLFADGMIDPVPDRNLTAPTPLHRKEYTIFQLNFDIELSQPRSFNKIWEHPRCPAALGSQLRSNYAGIYAGRG